MIKLQVILIDLIQNSLMLMRLIKII